MKTTLLVAIAMFATAYIVRAQAVEQPNDSINKWSVEFNAGLNRPLYPFTTGYGNRGLQSPYVNHLEVGARYMMSEKFGFRLDFARDHFENKGHGSALPFEAVQYRVGFQGVINAGRMMSFESFSNRLGLLVHAGVQLAQRTPLKGPHRNFSEADGGLMLGLTPQFRLSNRLVLTGDFSMIANFTQHYPWDGMSVQTEKSGNLTGQMLTASLGLTIYLGKHRQHADWYIRKPQPLTSKVVEQQLEELQGMLQDTDRDGVADYLDLQQNTPSGVTVDTKGRFLDENHNGVPDELETVSGRDGRDATGAGRLEKSDAVRLLFEKGYVNIFYDVNKVKPNSGSAGSVYQVIQFLKQYPDARIRLVGFADTTGSEAANQDLSRRRSLKLAQLIMSSGIEGSRIAVEGQGADKNISHGGPYGLTLSRRVSVILQ